MSLAARPSPSSGSPIVSASADAPWTDEQAAHLLRRAGFGGTPEQINHLVKLGRDGAVDLLVDYQDTEQTDPGYPADAFPDRPPPLRGIIGMTEEQRRTVTQAALRCTEPMKASRPPPTMA